MRFPWKGIVLTGTALAIIAMGIGYYQKFGTSKEILKNIKSLFIPETTLTTFDNHPKLNPTKDPGTGSKRFESNPEIVKDGINAIAATQEDNRRVLDQEPPSMVKPEPGEFAPEISMILPIDLTNTQLSIFQRYGPTGKSDEDAYYTGAENIIFSGTNTPVFVPRINGADSVSVKLIDNLPGSQEFVLDYNLEDEQILKVTMSVANHDLVANDALKGSMYSIRDYKTATELWALQKRDHSDSKKSRGPVVRGVDQGAV